MKSYPSINYYGDNWGLPIIAFDKLDGSNIRFEYSKKKGFYKFGTKNTLIDENTDIFGAAISLFKNKYEEDLKRAFRKNYRDILSFVCFAEFVGEKSEYGQHFPGDNYDIVLFDVNAYKKGFIKPREFVKNFGHLDIPRIIYDGALNKEFVEDVKENKFNLKEGVIGKGVLPRGGSEQLYYCKIKTNQWLENLRLRGGDKTVEEELRKHTSNIEL